MENTVRMSEKYRKKIKLFFAEDWILLSIALIVILYSLSNYISNSSFTIFGINRGKSLILGTILITIFIVKFFFISVKIKSRLIYEIIDENSFYSLILYNKSFVKLHKTLIPVYKEKADYFLNYLFSPNGTINNLAKTKSERFVVIIDNKKYYFLPFLFEEKVFI